MRMDEVVDEAGDLEALLKLWQHELRLDQWDIEMRFMNRSEHDHDIHGTSCAARYHRALILLKNPDERSDAERERFRLGYEVVIVHELLHILESVWRDNPKVEDVMDKDEWIKRLHENTLDATAEALVRARRGTKR